MAKQATAVRNKLQTIIVKAHNFSEETGEVEKPSEPVPFTAEADGKLSNIGVHPVSVLDADTHSILPDLTDEEKAEVISASILEPRAKMDILTGDYVASVLDGYGAYDVKLILT